MLWKTHSMISSREPGCEASVAHDTSSAGLGFPRALVLMLLVAVMAVVPLWSPPVAAAGTNGQQVAVKLRDQAWVQIQGHNQNNQYVKSPWFYGPSGSYYYLSNYWWKGTISITVAYDSTMGWLYTRYTAVVPTSQWWSNWTYIDVPN